MKRVEAINVADWAGFQGNVLLPGADEYESARTIWNGMIDRRPALIVQCLTTEDVVHAVGVARRNSMPLAVRGGGHNIGGSALVDDGIVIDLSRMKRVDVNPATRRAVVEGGALLSDMDAATQAHGLATPLGINSTTGVGGLTLGGGFGWLSRKYGMTVDNLEAVEMVLADGRVVRASESSHPDLFWAVRGGGGNFGVVTRFEFRLHPVGPEVLCGLIVYSMSEATSVLRQYRDFVAKAPDELSVWAVMRKAPPLPFLPESVHGQNVVVLAMCHLGDPAAGASLVEPLRHFGTVLGEHVGPAPLVAWQQAFDPLLTADARNYWKSHNLDAVSDGFIDCLIEAVDTLPSPHCEILIVSMGGAISRVEPGATAYAHRAARFVTNVHGRWESAAEDERGVRWARDFFEKAARFATGGVYVNFITDDERGRVHAAYGANYQRLARVKRTYDPDNLFRVNQNIRPQ